MMHAGVVFVGDIDGEVSSAERGAYLDEDVASLAFAGKRCYAPCRRLDRAGYNYERISVQTDDIVRKMEPASIVTANVFRDIQLVRELNQMTGALQSEYCSVISEAL